MEVILSTKDGTEMTATIQSLRAFPMLLQWADLNNPLPPRFFVRAGDNLDNRYSEVRPEPILTLAGGKGG